MGDSGAGAGAPRTGVVIEIDPPLRASQVGSASIGTPAHEPKVLEAKSSPPYMQTTTPMKEDKNTRTTSYGRQIKTPSRLGCDEESHARNAFSSDEAEYRSTGESSDLEELPRSAQAKRRPSSKQFHEPPESLQEKLEKARELYHEKNKEHKNLKKVKADLGKQHIAEKKQNKEHEKTIKGLQAGLAQSRLLLGTVRLEHAKVLAARQESFYNAQASLQELIQRNASPEEPDDVVRRKCKEIQAGLQQWARDWAGDTMKASSAKYLLELLHYARVDRSQLSIEMLSTRLARKPAGTAILLLIGVTKTTFNLTLADRFGNLEAFGQGGNNMREALQGIHELGSEGDKAKLHGWRASTRSLFESIYASAQSDYERGLKGLTGMAYVISETSRKFYAKEVHEFIDSTARCLLKSVSPEEEVQRHEELLSIFQAAGDLAARLWSQKTEMVLLDGLTIQRQNLSFDIGSPLMEAHRSMGCDSESHEFDGRPVDLVLVPGILAYGNSEGKQYDKYKIWMKSTVLVFTGEGEATSTGCEEHGDQEKPLLRGRRSPTLDVEDFDRPSKRIKIEEEEQQTMLAATAKAEPAKKTPATKLRSNVNGASSTLAPQKLSTYGTQEPDARKTSSSDTQGPSAITIRNLRLNMNKSGPSREPKTSAPGSQTRRNTSHARPEESYLANTLATIDKDHKNPTHGKPEEKASEKAEEERREKGPREARSRAGAALQPEQSANIPKQQVEPFLKKEEKTIDLTEEPA